VRFFAAIEGPQHDLQRHPYGGKGFADIANAISVAKANEVTKHVPSMSDKRDGSAWTSQPASVIDDHFFRPTHHVLSI
jgi:hypothetical protein